MSTQSINIFLYHWLLHSQHCMSTTERCNKKVCNQYVIFPTLRHFKCRNRKSAISICSILAKLFDLFRVPPPNGRKLFDKFIRENYKNDLLHIELFITNRESRLKTWLWPSKNCDIFLAQFFNHRTNECVMEPNTWT